MRIKNKVLVAFVVGFVALAAAGLAQAARTTPAEASLLRAMNGARAAHGLRPLRFDATLERAARAHSAEMLRSGVFTHGSFLSRVLSFGARGPQLGENLAWGVGAYANPGNIIRQWLASPSHRANLLRPGYTRIGVGALRGAFQGQAGALVITADFGGR
jgi:uncharacterized protein YkwD